MTNVWAVLGQKGGTGKTTVAVALAVAAPAEARARIIDTDDQATAALWGDRRRKAPPAGRAEPIVTRLKAATVAGALAPLAGQGGLVVVDGPGRASHESVILAKLAQMVIVPLRPSIADMDTLGTVRAILDGAGSPPHLVVLNGVPSRGGQVGEARALLQRLGFNVWPGQLGQRVAHSGAMLAGAGATEWEPNGKAALEVQSLYEYINSFLVASMNTATGKRKAKGR